jgi:phage gpG-like protein
MSVRIDLSGWGEEADRAERWAALLGDIREIAPDVFSHLEQQQKQNFEGEGLTYYGREWPRLSPRYKRWKDRHYPGRKILVLTGAMKHSLTRRRDRNAIREKVGPSELVFGSKDRKAMWHQDGTEHMPMRTIIMSTRDDAQTIVEILRDALEAA